MKDLFIVGTGTDVGKTYVTGLIVDALQKAGESVAYYKAAMSGNERDAKGGLIPGDAKFVKDISGVTQSLEEMCPYIYEKAFSPHLAARLEGNPVDLQLVKKQFADLSQKYEFVTMEGSGGIICPIREDEQSILLEDVITELNLPCLLIADAGLGTINSVVLTVDYLRRKNIEVRGIIFNHYEEGNVMHEDNLRMCEKLSGIPVVCKVPANAKMLPMGIEQLKTLYKEKKK